MRNLSPLGAIHSPIDAGRDPSAYVCDFAALGLPDHSPFDILSRPRAPIKATPVKVRKPNKTRLEQTLAALNDRNFNVPIMTREQSDRTLAIHGRGLS